MRLVKAAIPGCSINAHGGRTSDTTARGNGGASSTGSRRLRVGIVLSGGQAPGAWPAVYRCRAVRDEDRMSNLCEDRKLPQHLCACGSGTATARACGGGVSAWCSLAARLQVHGRLCTDLGLREGGRMNSLCKDKTLHRRLCPCGNGAVNRTASLPSRFGIVL